MSRLRTHNRRRLRKLHPRRVIAMSYVISWEGAGDGGFSVRLGGISYTPKWTYATFKGSSGHDVLRAVPEQTP